jgi:hypothetical protein
MNRKTKTLIVTGIILIPVFLHSCTCIRKKDGESSNVPATAFKAELAEIVRDSIFYLLSSPGEILERIQGTVTQYHPELLNPVENRERYLGLSKQSLNLGVYISDMAYSALYNRSSETIRFLEAVKTVSSEVGISTSVFESLISRAQNNSGNMDSLISISNEAYINMLEFLETGGKKMTLAIVSAGAYIESLYLILNSSEEYKEGDPVLILISDMKFPLENLYELSELFKEDENMKEIISQLHLIRQVLQDLESSGSKMVISKDQNGIISIAGGEKYSLDRDNYAVLKTRVTGIRKNIVSY